MDSVHYIYNIYILYIINVCMCTCNNNKEDKKLKGKGVMGGIGGKPGGLEIMQI